MRKILYIAAEIFALYFVTVGIMLVFIWLTTGFGFAGVGLAILSLVSAIPFAVRGATIGFRNQHSLGSAMSFGFYRPMRLIAFVMPTITALQDESDNGLFGHREKMHFHLGDGHGVGANDAIAALSAHLKEQGIPCTNVGGLTVRDNGVKWWLEPVADKNVLAGWVESADAENRQLVIDGIGEFLRGLELAAAA